MASTYLTRTPSSETANGRRKWTFSFWMKRADTSGFELFGADADGARNNNYHILDFSGSNDNLDFNAYESGSIFRLITSRKFRDTNSWYHILIAWDTTQATASDRVKIYVNGVQETAFDTETYPSQNYQGKIFSSGKIHHIGGRSGAYFNGVLSHIHACEGYVYQPSDFGETDSTTGEWKIKTSPSVSYGTNGFFILKDGNSVTDQSGNSNNFTVAGGTLTNTEDCPSNVFATWNSLVPLGTFSNGSTVWTSASSGDGSAFSTLGAEAGKYYMECKITNANASGWELGVAPVTRLDGNANGVGTSTVGGVGYTGDGYIRRAGTTVASGLTTFAQNDIISCALDMDTRKVYFYKNGTILNSGTGVDLPSTTGHYVFATGDWYSSASTSASANFGNGYFGTTAVSSAGTNASGIGIFEYDVPTGYTALSTKGLNE